MHWLPLACQHCENPRLHQGLPGPGHLLAARTALVMQDHERCIGCRFCMVACPYGVRDVQLGRARPAHATSTPAWSPPRPVGTMEKCTFCVHRLADGQVPVVRLVVPGAGAHLRRPQRPGQPGEPAHPRARRRAAARGARHRPARLLPAAAPQERTGAHEHRRHARRRRPSRAAGDAARLRALDRAPRRWASPSGLGAWVYQLAHGLAVTNMRNPMMWGLYITLFMYFVGLSAGGLIVASAGRLFGATRLKPDRPPRRARGDRRRHARRAAPAARHRPARPRPGTCCATRTSPRR